MSLRPFRFVASARLAANFILLLAASGAWAWPAIAQSPAPDQSPAPAGAQSPASLRPAPPAAGRFEEVLGRSGGLTARDAGRRAAATSVQAAVRHEQIAAAESARSQVIWGAAPRVTLTGQATRYSYVAPFRFQLPDTLTGGAPLPDFAMLQNTFSLGARLSVPFTDYFLRLFAALRGAGANETAARLEERSARLTAAANAKLGYYDWVRARLARVLAAQSLEQAQRQLDLSRSLASVGRSAQADVLQAQAFAADAELAYTQTQTDEALAEERLRTALHAPPGEQLNVGEDVLAAFPGANEPHDVEALYREALAQRLELQSLDKNRDAAEQSRAVEASRAWPRLEGFGDINYANPNPRVFPQQDRWDATWDVGLSLVWSSSDPGSSAASAEAARAQRDELVHQRTLAEESLRLEIVSALRALGQARLNVTTAEQGEQAAVAAFDARSRLSAQGLATGLELIQAQTAEARAKLNLINAHIALRAARVQLDHAVGRDSSEL